MKLHKSKAKNIYSNLKTMNLRQSTVPTLQNNLYALYEGSEDITYRTFDLLFQKFPQYRPDFPHARNKHPHVFSALLGLVRRFEISDMEVEKKSIQRYLDLYRIDELPIQCLLPLRACMIQAIHDVLFDASDELVSACTDVFDALIKLMMYLYVDTVHT